MQHARVHRTVCVASDMVAASSFLHALTCTSTRCDTAADARAAGLSRSPPTSAPRLAWVMVRFRVRVRVRVRARARARVSLP